MEEMTPREPENIQRVVGLNGEDATADYVSACREDFVAALTRIFPKIALGVFQQEKDITGTVTSDAENIFQSYFQSMKGQVNFTLEGLKSFIVQEIRRQQRFYRELHALAAGFAAEGAKFTVLKSGDIQCEICWNTGIVPGTGIVTENGAHLYACPLVPAYSTDYMALRQEPVAANILAVSPELILFLPVNQDPEDRFLDACSKIFPVRQDITGELPSVWSACLLSGFILIDSSEPLTPDEIENLRTKYGVHAVVAANSAQFQARIHTGKNDRLICPGDLPDVLSSHFQA